MKPRFVGVPAGTELRIASPGASSETAIDESEKLDMTSVSGLTDPTATAVEMQAGVEMASNPIPFSPSLPEAMAVAMPAVRS